MQRCVLIGATDPLKTPAAKARSPSNPSDVYMNKTFIRQAPMGHRKLATSAFHTNVTEGQESWLKYADQGDLISTPLMLGNGAEQCSPVLTYLDAPKSDQINERYPINHALIKTTRTSSDIFLWQDFVGC